DDGAGHVAAADECEYGAHGYDERLSTRMFKMMHRRHLLAATALLALTPFLQAQTWPAKPVKIVVPAPAGSSLDVIARLLGDKLKDRWTPPGEVENRPGAGGMIGMDI